MDHLKTYAAHAASGGMPGKRPNPIDLLVGRNVRLHRMAAALSQEAFAQKIGVALQQVQKFEAGTSRIGAGRLLRIAALLDVPIPYLFEGAAAVDADGHSHALPGETID